MNKLKVPQKCFHIWYILIKHFLERQNGHHKFPDALLNANKNHDGRHDSPLLVVKPVCFLQKYGITERVFKQEKWDENYIRLESK
jgi:hypothetical protein